MLLTVREGMVPGSTLAERLDWLDDSPYDGIELHGEALAMPPADLVAAFRGRRVRASALTGGVDLISPDPTVRREREESVRERLRLGGRLGCAAAIVIPIFGRAPVLPDLSPFRTAIELEREVCVAQIRALAPTAAESGVAIALEPLNRYESHFLRQLSDAAVVIAAAGGPPGVGILADFFHMNIEEGDIAEALRAAGALVRYVHVADSNRYQPGQGHLDLTPGFRALKEIGYDSWIGIETSLTDPPDAALREGAETVRAAWARA